MAFVRLLAKLLHDKDIGKYIVPIVPDEARTFGMESLFSADRHLLAHRPALRAGRFGHAAVLQGGEGRPDPRRRHHRSGLDVDLHRRRHRVCHARRQHDSVLHLLLDVRLPADRRPDLGRGDSRRTGFLSAARPGGRRSPAKACSIRTATAISGDRRPDVRPTTRPSPTRWP